MRKFILTLFALLGLGNCGEAAFWQGQTYQVPAVQQMTCNFLTGVVTNGPGPCVSPVAVCDGINNDTSAAVSFKTWALANQDTTGTIQTVLYIPSGSDCRFTFAGYPQLAWVKGIKNFLLSGYGATISPQATMLFGGRGQIQDNKNSVRLQTVSAGSSCVNFVTSPTPTISNVTNSTSTPATFTASVTPIDYATSTMTVTAMSSGTIAVGQQVIATGMGRAVFIVSQSSGTPGGVGDYVINASRTITSRTFNTGGVMRLTVSSTAGIADGATIYISGVVGTGNMDFAVNGLQWIRVVDGTHLDLFQVPFKGSYVSGGTIGGDRTGLFAVGRYALITGYTTQFYWARPYGFPSNPQFFEYVKVASINSGTQEVCFDAPLTNTYKSTWPQLNTGETSSVSGGEVDPGGPATLYALDPDWDVTIEYAGVTIYDPTRQATANGRSVTWRDSTMIGGCVVPSQNLLWQYINNDLSACDIETDKIVKLLKVTGGTNYKWTFQSPSILEAEFTDTTLSNALIGSPNKFTGLRLTVGAQTLPGARAYGVSTGPWLCTDCNLNSLDFGGFNQFADNTAHTIWSMASGVIKIPNTSSYDPSAGASETQTRAFVPGGYTYWSGAQVLKVFKVVDVTQDLDFTYVQTSEAGTFPAAPYSGGGVLNVNSHPATDFTCANCTGGASTVARSTANCAANIPLMSCYAATATGGATGTTTQLSFAMWGTLVSAEFTVPTPYTGGGALTWKLSQFDNWPALTSAYATTQWGTSMGGGPTINAKLTGTRTITATGTSGAQSGDVLNAPGAGVLFGRATNNGSVFSANTPSDSPQVTVKMVTDQALP